MKLLRTRFLTEHLPTTASGGMEEHATPNDISKAYNQKASVICFLGSTYGRFMEFLIGTS